MDTLVNKTQSEEGMVLILVTLIRQIFVGQTMEDEDVKLIIYVLIQITIITLNNRYILNLPDPHLIEPNNILVPITIHIKIYILVL